MEARGGIEPPMRVLQTLALPLGYRAQMFIAGLHRGYAEKTPLSHRGNELLFHDEGLAQNRAVGAVVLHSTPRTTSMHFIKQNR
jgi:hypothetical protein